MLRHNYPFLFFYYSFTFTFLLQQSSIYQQSSTLLGVVVLVSSSREIDNQPLNQIFLADIQQVPEDFDEKKLSADDAPAPHASAP